MGVKLLSDSITFKSAQLSDASNFAYIEGMLQIPTYTTFASLANTFVPANVSMLRTGGYYQAGDGGHGPYAKVASNPNLGRACIQSKDGAWWVLITNGSAPIEQFGGIGDCVFNTSTSIKSSGTDNRQAFLDAIAFLSYTQTNMYFTRGLEILISYKSYYISGGSATGAAALELHKGINIRGQGNGMNIAGAVEPSVLLFDAGVCCIRTNTNNTSGSGAASSSGDSGGCSIIGVGIKAQNTQYVQGAHGIQMRNQTHIEKCSFRNIGDTCIYGFAQSGGGGSVEGQTNASIIRDVHIQDNWGDGINIGGADGNTIHVENVEIHYVRGCGIINIPYFNNNFISIFINNYGNSGVQYNGIGYTWQGGTGIHTNTNRPDQDPNNWFYIGPVSANDSAFPPWSATGSYRLTVPVWSPSTGSGFWGLYIEGQRVPAIIAGPVFNMTGGTQGSTNQNFNTGYNSTIVTGSGFGRRALFNPPDAPYATVGSDYFVGIGTHSYATTAPSILTFYRTLYGESEASPYTWGYYGQDLIFAMFNQAAVWQITGLSTTQTFNTPNPQPHIFGVSSLGLYNYRDYYHTQFGATISIPNGTPLAKGQVYINQNSNAGGKLFYVCTQAGLYGSTAVVKLAGAIDS